MKFCIPIYGYRTTGSLYLLYTCSMQQQHAERVQGYVLAGLLGSVAFLTFLIFKPFLTPLALAAIFAVVLYPVYRFFLKHMSGWRGFAAVLTMLAVTLCLIIPFGFMTVLVIGEAQETYVSLTQGAGLATTQEAILFLGSSVEPYVPGAAELSAQVATDINSYFRSGLEWLLDNIGGTLASVIGIGLDIFIFFIALFVFLKEGPRIRQGLLWLSPFNDADDARILDRLGLTINSVVRGSLAVGLAQGIVASIGYVIFGVPNPLLWGLLTSIAALVPGIGTALVLTPAIAYLFIVGESVSALGLLAWGILAVGLIDNLLGPALIGRGVHLPSLVILLSVLGGLIFFGPAGIFLGPLSVSLLIALFALYAGAGKKGSA